MADVATIHIFPSPLEGEGNGASIFCFRKSLAQWVRGRKSNRTPLQGFVTPAKDAGEQNLSSPSRGEEKKRRDA